MSCPSCSAVADTAARTPGTPCANTSDSNVLPRRFDGSAEALNHIGKQLHPCVQPVSLALWGRLLAGLRRAFGCARSFCLGLFLCDVASGLRLVLLTHD